MNAKKLIVGSVVATTLTLFAGAMYSQQPTVPQEDTAQTSIAREEGRARPDAQATPVGIVEGGDAQSRRSGQRSAEPPDGDREFRPMWLRHRYADASAVDRSERSFGRRSHEAHQDGGRTLGHEGSHR